MSFDIKHVTIRGIEYVVQLNYDSIKERHELEHIKRKKYLWDLDLDIAAELELCKYELSDEFITDVFSALSLI